MKVYIVTGNIAWHEDGPVAVFTDQAAANDYRHTGNHDEVYGVEVWDVVPERAEVLTLLCPIPPYGPWTVDERVHTVWASEQPLEYLKRCIIQAGSEWEPTGVYQAISVHGTDHDRVRATFAETVEKTKTAMTEAGWQTEWPAP